MATKIIPLMEGAFTIDKTKQFVPFNLETDNLQERATGSLLVEIQPFVIITDDDIFLLDAGLGFRMPNGTLQIHHNLMNAGINPMEVTKVLMSHLHKDHAGGVSFKDNQLGQYFLSFPNATYYINKNELAYAFEKGLPSYVPEELTLLLQSDRIVLMEDEGVIDGYIRHQVTGGHSPFHQVFWIDAPDKIVFYGGDDAPQLGQMKNKIVAKYDYDGKKCMELRQEWWERGQQEHWTFLFYHDVKYPVAVL